MSPNASQPSDIQSLPIPAIPDALIMNGDQAITMSAEGEVNTQTILELSLNKSYLVCFAPHITGRLNIAESQLLDVLELFAFIKPGQFCVPSIAGLAQSLGFERPESAEEAAMMMPSLAHYLLKELKTDPHRGKADPLLLAQIMGQKGRGWRWSPYVCAALGEAYDPEASLTDRREGLRVWKHLAEWSEEAPLPPPAHHAVTVEEALQRLDQMLAEGHKPSDKRDVQHDYARTLSAAFIPVQNEDETHVVAAQAGTGVGKTLGYIAPASVWAEKNDGTVWLSTFTKNLQRQIVQELERLYPDPDTRAARTAIRKGRENYLCLLNLEEAAMGATTAYDPRAAVAAGLMLRWAAATEDGDLNGESFPGWLQTLLGYQYTSGLSDKRGECIYTACDHYHKCFIEKATRHSRRARIVVANHALVMIQTALEGRGEELPKRYVFDEAHHLFDAADSAFSVQMSMREAVYLRRWILGPEGGKAGRMRGLHRRLEGLIEGEAEMEAALQSLQMAAKALPGHGWGKRLNSALPDGEIEGFFHAVIDQIRSRTTEKNGPYSLETDLFPITEALTAHLPAIKKKLQDLKRPMLRIAACLRDRLNADTEGNLNKDERRRLDSLACTLERRAHYVVSPWVSLIETMEHEQGTPEFVDWMELTRVEGQAFDVGIFRHWIDPMQPFAAALKPHTDGLAMTSATLTSRSDEGEESWQSARQRTGLDYLSANPVLFEAESPFDYSTQTKIFVVSDVRKDDPQQVAAAYQALFKAAGGGALGLFTAIHRLKSTYELIQDDLRAQHIPLYAQHIDPMDSGTLVDIFRDEENACLLGTDAMRDGVDVPGRSLRLIVFDRVPWPRPTILHRARRQALGRKVYDDQLTELKLKQAFGRLIRTRSDRGIFTMLDPLLPSRLQVAFPEGVEVIKCGLNEAVSETKRFLLDTE